MHGYFTKIDVGDPHLLSQSMWENLSPDQRVLLNEREFSSQEWAPLDERRFRLEPESYRTELSFANFGALRLSRSASSQATRMTTRLPAGDGFGISLIERGESQLVFPGTDEPAGGRVQPILLLPASRGCRPTEAISPSLMMPKPIATTICRLRPVISVFHKDEKGEVSQWDLPFHRPCHERPR